jgi:hypothetical protein
MDIFVARRQSISDPFDTVEPVSEINLPNYDGVPFVSGDGLEIYFASRGHATGNELFDLYFATRPSRDRAFGEPQVISTPNQSLEEFYPSVSADRLSLHYEAFSGTEDTSGIFLASRASTSDSWGPFEKVQSLSENPLNVWGVRESSNGLSMLVEEENLSDTRGASDLYLRLRATRSDPWGPLINLGAAINTEHFDTLGGFTANGSRLYFARMEDPAGYGGDPNRRSVWEVPLALFESVPLNGTGDAHSENFDSLGVNASQPGTPLPTGWTFTVNDVIFNNSTTGGFSTTTRQYAGAHNAGAGDTEDRSLVTDVTRDEAGELDFRTLITGDKLQAVRLGFDIEAWQLRSGLGANAGEAAFQVVLEVDSGNGFQQVADLREFSTGKTLARPANGSLVDGNHPAYRRSFDTGPIDVGDIPAGATLRTRWIGTAGSRNVVFGLDNVSLRFAAPGDANIDGVFNSGDLVHVFQVGEYEDAIAGNSTWSDGDWTNDNEFDSSDLVAAFQQGNYVEAASPVNGIPEPTSAVLLLIGCYVFRGHRRRVP